MNTDELSHLAQEHQKSIAKAQAQIEFAFQELKEAQVQIKAQSSELTNLRHQSSNQNLSLAELKNRLEALEKAFKKLHFLQVFAIIGSFAAALGGLEGLLKAYKYLSLIAELF